MSPPGFRSGQRAGADTGGAAEPGLYGAVAVGGLTLAVPIEAIREVVPRPAALLPFPATRAEIIGAITLRGATVPVLDAERLLALQSTGACPIILILRDCHRVIGLAVQSVAGVLALAEDDLTHLEGSAGGDGRSRLIRTAFARGALDGMILDIRALAALPDMPLAAERLAAPARLEGTATGVATLLFSAGSVRLGLAASVIEASVPEQLIAPSPVDDALWVGWIVHNGRRVPLVDTLRLLGLGEYATSERAAAVIVRLASGHQVGLRIDAVSDIQSLTDHDITSLQEFRVGNHALFKGLYDRDGTSLVLESRAVAEDAKLAAIGRVFEEAPATTDVTSVTGEVCRFLLVLLAGQRLAIPLDQVEEIVATRSSGIGLSDRERAITDFTVHRGRGVPLIDLQKTLGLPGNGSSARFTVIVSADGNHAGFLVEDLCAVERAVVQRSRAVASSRALERVAATISTGGCTYSVIDLRQIITTLCVPPPLVAGTA